MSIERLKLAEKVIQMIADGYPYRVFMYEDFSFMQIDNTDYKPDDGSDPFVIWEF